MYNDRPSITLPCNVMQQTPPPPGKKTKQTKKPKNKPNNTQNKTKTANTNQTLYAKKVC